VRLPAGPSLRFHIESVIALAGAQFKGDVDGVPVPFWTSVRIKAGAVLTVGTVSHGRQDQEGNFHVLPRACPSHGGLLAMNAVSCCLQSSCGVACNTCKVEALLVIGLRVPASIVASACVCDPPCGWFLRGFNRLHALLAAGREEGRQVLSCSGGRHQHPSVPGLALDLSRWQAWRHPGL
jgi:hypothetical protein